MSIPQSLKSRHCRGWILVVCTAVAVILTGCSSHAPAPLWPGSTRTEADCTNAMLRALRFIERSAANSANFEAQASDYLYCFYSIAATAREPELRTAAREIGSRYAKKWAAMRASIAPHMDKEELADMVFGWLPASLLGEDDTTIKPQLRRELARYKAVDFMSFDPAIEPPPSDLPAVCKYDGRRNPRGSKLCEQCRRPLEMRSKYEVWLDALIVSYSGDRYGIRIGASYRDVLKWIPAMRPYPSPRNVSSHVFLDVLYALTHVVYTLNDYGHYRIRPDLLPQEFTYLRQNLEQAIALHDPETIGEFLDALKAFGLGRSDTVIQKGMKYLLDTQRADGTWGPPGLKDAYTLYHSAWTGIDGLKECCWQGERISFPDLEPLLESMRQAGPPHKP